MSEGMPSITEFDSEPSLDELQKVVGGYVTAVRTKDGRTMYVNEEGLLKGLPPNMEAYLLTGRLIVGDVAIVKKGDEG